MSLTGGPHLNPVVLVSLADGILSTEGEAVVPGVLEHVGQVKRCFGHQHRVALSVLQGETFRLEAPAQMQRWATEQQMHIFQKRLGKEQEPRPSPGKVSTAETSEFIFIINLVG